MISYVKKFIILYCIKNYMFIPASNLILYQVKNKTYEYIKELFMNKTEY